MIWQGSRIPEVAAEPNPLEKFRRVAPIPLAITVEADGPGEQPSTSKRPRLGHTTVDPSGCVEEDTDATSSEGETGAGMGDWGEDAKSGLERLKDAVEGLIQYQRFLEEDLRGECVDQCRLCRELRILEEGLHRAEGDLRKEKELRRVDREGFRALLDRTNAYQEDVRKQLLDA